MKEDNRDINESEFVVGRNSVTEALQGGRSLNKILIAKGERQGSIGEIIRQAKEKGIVIQEVDVAKLDLLSGGVRHQGVLAYVAPVSYVEVEDILELAQQKGEVPFLILLDEIHDPHNVGALLRTADCAGVHGVLMPKRRSCPLNATVAKTSAGALEYVPVARVGNVVQTLQILKKQGFWVAGADMNGTQTYYQGDLTGPLVLVIGSEGEGIGRLIKEECDFLLRIPMCGHMNSLNASVAGALLMYEAMRQRQGNTK